MITLPTKPELPGGAWGQRGARSLATICVWLVAFAVVGVQGEAWADAGFGSIKICPNEAEDGQQVVCRLVSQNVSKTEQGDAFGVAGITVTNTFDKITLLPTPSVTPTCSACAGTDTKCTSDAECGGAAGSCQVRCTTDEIACFRSQATCAGNTLGNCQPDSNQPLTNGSIAVAAGDDVAGGADTFVCLITETLVALGECRVGGIEVVDTVVYEGTGQTPGAGLTASDVRAEVIALRCCGDGLVNVSGELCDTDPQGAVPDDLASECPNPNPFQPGYGCLESVDQQCRLPKTPGECTICGDGKLQAGLEQCDRDEYEEGAPADRGECRASGPHACTFCGDGIKQAGELCDDGVLGSVEPGDRKCRGTSFGDDICTRCGDGILQVSAGEECDDGNQVDDDECSNDCFIVEEDPFCGDGVCNPEPGLDETCDGDDFFCTPNAPPGRTCRTPESLPEDLQLFACTFCGDGVIDIGLEECDDGNDVDDDECRNDCTEPRCGDEIVDDFLNETCDPPGMPWPPNDNACRDDCTYCGDGNIDPGESCDDGNDNPNDGCNNECGPSRGCPNTAFLIRTKGNIGNGGEVIGSIGVNEERGFLRIGRESVVFDSFTTSGDLVRLLVGSSVYDVAANQLLGDGAVRGRREQLELPLVEPFCPISEDIACDPETNVFVSGRSSVDLTPGAYGTVKVARGATLTLAAGDYAFCSIRTSRGATIRIVGPRESTIGVAGIVRIASGSFLGRGSASTPIPELNVTGRIVRVSQGSSLEAWLSAPESLLSMGRVSTFLGSFCVNRLRSDKNTRLECPPGFVGSASAAFVDPLQ